VPCGNLYSRHAPLSRAAGADLPTVPSTSPTAVVSFRYRKKLISALSAPGKLLASRKSKKCIRLVSLMDCDLAYIDREEKLCSLSTTLLAQNCYLCSQYILLPMCPDWTEGNWSGRWESNPPQHTANLLNPLIPAARLRPTRVHNRGYFFNCFTVRFTYNVPVNLYGRASVGVAKLSLNDFRRCPRVEQ
jgi:hypothetical protein